MPPLHSAPAPLQADDSRSASHADPSGFHPSSMSTSSYETPSISHPSPVQAFSHGLPVPMDFASNVPSLWGYQNLLGFLPDPLATPAAVGPVFAPPRLTSPNFEPHHPYEQSKSNSASPSGTLPVSTSTLSGCENQYPPFGGMGQNAVEFASRSSAKSSSVFKMFKCTLDPSCEMEFTRAEHLARHERKHTKEKPFQCHCSKSFSRLDNWRQHKVSVHRDQVEENALTEERLVQVHKTMQRQNNIRKVATLAAQRQGHLDRTPSRAGSFESPHSPAVNSAEENARRQSCACCLGQSELHPFSPYDHSPYDQNHRRKSEPGPLRAPELNTRREAETVLRPDPFSRPSTQLPGASFNRSSHWSQFGTPSPNYSTRPPSDYYGPHEAMSLSNSSPNYPTIMGPMLIPPGSNFDMSTPSSLSYDTPRNSETSSGIVHQYPSRRPHYNRCSRLPLSSLWPSSQESLPGRSCEITKLSHRPYPLADSSSGMLQEADNEVLSPAGCMSQPTTDEDRRILRLDNDDFLNHLKLMSPLACNERNNNIPPFPMRRFNCGLSKYVENQPCYSSFELGRNGTVGPLLEPGNEYLSKRELANDFGSEEGTTNKDRQRNVVKRMRI